jgi:hypothetical protein
MEFVNWDDVPTEWKNNPNVPNHQQDCHISLMVDLPSYKMVDLSIVFSMFTRGL